MRAQSFAGPFPVVVFVAVEAAAVLFVFVPNKYTDT